jgi:hypothetical protein
MFEYIGNKRITVGGKVISASNLTTLDSRTLKIAVKNKVIKEQKDVKEKSISKKRASPSDGDT